MTAYPTKPSEPSARVESTTIVSVERFFNDVADLPYQPLPEHAVEQSPCYPIIGRNNNRSYFCRLHPEVKNVNLESIEHHCKYKDPDYHKSEILKMLSTKSPDNELAAKGNEVERWLPSPRSFDIQVKSDIKQTQKNCRKDRRKTSTTAKILPEDDRMAKLHQLFIRKSVNYCILQANLTSVKYKQKTLKQAK